MDWDAKVEGQDLPGVTGKFGVGVQNEAGQRLIEFCEDNALVIANTLFQQHKRRLYTWTSPDGQYWNQIDFYFTPSNMWVGESNGTPLQYSCLENPMDGGAISLWT